MYTHVPRVRRLAFVFFVVGCASHLAQFFGDNKPPVPGPVPDPTASRWVVDTQSGATILFTWFPDDRVAVTTTLCSRFGEWAYELNFFYGVTEGTLPVKVRVDSAVCGGLGRGCARRGLRRCEVWSCCWARGAGARLERDVRLRASWWA